VGKQLSISERTKIKRMYMSERISTLRRLRKACGIKAGNAGRRPIDAF